ncbi:probable protein phosphatase 2C 37 isoform X3 [Panicum hallii]|uniref:probable protein phosphatase 2C 37 isoform X3 n=1 Tax=Panicum hallii TaxID=206008 RepID=UPI000DF4D3E7|nr:probable protein phosphatase 2C 37 isoform X3 [Panicum hallii]
MVMASAGVNMPGGDGNPSAAASSSTPECRLRRRRRLAPPRAAAAGGEKRVRPASPSSSSSEDDSVEGEEGEADAAVEGDEEGGTTVSAAGGPQPPPPPGPAQAWPMAFGWLSVAGRSREMEDAVSLRPGFCTWVDGSPMHFFGVFDGHGGSHVSVHAVPGPDARVPGRGARRRGGGLPDPAAGCGGGGGGSSCSCIRDDELGRRRAGGGGGAGVARGAGADLPARRRPGVPGVRVRPHREPALPVHAVGQLRHRGLHRRGGRPGPRPPRRRQLRRLPRGALPGARRRPARPALRRPQARPAGRAGADRGGWRPGGVHQRASGAWDPRHVARTRYGDRMLRPEVIAEPEITITDRTPEDQCLILASDGMWDVIPNEIACSVARQCLEDGNPAPVDDVPPTAGGEGAAAAAVAESSEPEARCSRAASLLVRLALGRTTWDNVSVVVIDLKQRE